MAPERIKVRCPTCGREVVGSTGALPPQFPFCSERCRLIDLGKWFDGEHRIEEPLDGDSAPDSDAAEGQ